MQGAAHANAPDLQPSPQSARGIAAKPALPPAPQQEASKSVALQHATVSQHTTPASAKAVHRDSVQKAGHKRKQAPPALQQKTKQAKLVYNDLDTSTESTTSSDCTMPSMDTDSVRVTKKHLALNTKPAVHQQEVQVHHGTSQQAQQLLLQQQQQQQHKQRHNHQPHERPLRVSHKVSPAATVRHDEPALQLNKGQKHSGDGRADKQHLCLPSRSSQQQLRQPSAYTRVRKAVQPQEAPVSHDAAKVARTLVAAVGVNVAHLDSW